MASNRFAELNGGDDEEEALRQAIAMSLGDSINVNEDSAPSTDTKTTRSSPGPSGRTSSSATSMFALGLDRRKMEEERLARLKKRKAETNFAAHGQDKGLPPARRPKLSNVQPADKPRVPQSALPITPSSLNPNTTNGNGNKGVSGMSRLSATARLPYPKGKVLRTWAHGSPRQDDIRIEEVLQKDDLELAVLSSFQWDEKWLMAKLHLKQTKVLLIAYAPDEATVS